MAIDTISIPERSNIISVAELTFAIKNQLEGRFKHVAIQGEVTNAKRHSSGHFYFDLKDANAKISAVMFRAQAEKLSRLPKEGDQVVLSGSLSVYPPHGRYQLIAASLEFAGVGELLLRLEQLKKNLRERGWFDQDKKKPLPPFPRTIGVVTSPTGAVIRDIIHVLKRRFAGFHLILNPVRVQGETAAYEIARAIEAFNTHQLADVLIVGRGGGSLEDLWPFNEEIVAQAIFQSRIPIVSAVGHETDVTLADFVADVRAPTPSAAAELVSAEKMHHLNRLNQLRAHTTHALSHLVKRTRAQLDRYRYHPLFSSSLTLLGQPMQRVDELKERLDLLMQRNLTQKKYSLEGRKKQARGLQPLTQVKQMQVRLNSLAHSLTLSSYNKLNTKKQQLSSLVQTLRSVDPKNVLKRGYSILFDEKEGSVIVSAQALSPGQRLKALLSDGSTNVEVCRDDE